MYVHINRTLNHQSALHHGCLGASSASHEDSHERLLEARLPPVFVSQSPVTVEIPSGKHTKNYRKSPCLMGKSSISMAIFNSYGCIPEGICHKL